MEDQTTMANDLSTQQTGKLVILWTSERRDMGLKVQGDTIESLIQERRDTEKESKQLQIQIERLKAEKLEKKEPGTLEALDRQIDMLSLEKREKDKKLKDICRIARTISAGD